MKLRTQMFFRRLWARYDETKLMQAVFFGMLIGVIVTLGLDYRELRRAQGNEPPTSIRQIPALPSIVPDDGAPDQRSNRPENVTTPAEIHRNAMTISLAANNILELKGTIMPETAAVFTNQITQLGEYIETISVDSPGGFLESALTIGAIIREKGFKTQIIEGALCASACPLLFAGGQERSVHPQSAFGLHQIYSTEQAQLSSAQAMADAQATTARITRYLDGMGVDSKVWTFALETPPARLYYLTKEELINYRFIKETK